MFRSDVRCCETPAARAIVFTFRGQYEPLAVRIDDYLKKQESKFQSRSPWNRVIASDKRSLIEAENLQGAITKKEESYRISTQVHIYETSEG
jgi:hypothetical protein